MSINFFSQYRKNIKGFFFFFFGSLVFLKISGAAHLSSAKNLMKHRRGVTRRCRNFYVSKKIFVGWPFWCFWKFLAPKKTILIIRNRNNIVKNICECWGSNPYLALQNAVVLPTVPWQPWEFLANVRKIIKIYGPIEIRTQTYYLRNFCPHGTGETTISK